MEPKDKKVTDESPTTQNNQVPLEANSSTGTTLVEFFMQAPCPELDLDLRRDRDVGAKGDHLF